MATGFSRKLFIGMVGIGMLILAVGSTASVGAAAPAGYPYGYAVNGCPVGYGCLVDAPVAYGSIPRDATYLPGVGYAYKDNRYCGDGNVIFTGSGYLCANGSPLYATNGYINGYPYVGAAPYVYANPPVGVVVPVPIRAPFSN